MPERALGNSWLPLCATRMHVARTVSPRRCALAPPGHAHRQRRRLLRPQASEDSPSPCAPAPHLHDFLPGHKHEAVRVGRRLRLDEHAAHLRLLAALARLPGACWPCERRRCSSSGCCGAGLRPPLSRRRARHLAPVGSVLATAHHGVCSAHPRRAGGAVAAPSGPSAGAWCRCGCCMRWWSSRPADPRSASAAAPRGQSAQRRACRPTLPPAPSGSAPSPRPASFSESFRWVLLLCTAPAQGLLCAKPRVRAAAPLGLWPLVGPAHRPPPHGVRTCLKREGSGIKMMAAGIRGG